MKLRILKIHTWDRNTGNWSQICKRARWLCNNIQGWTGTKISPQNHKILVLFWHDDQQRPKCTVHRHPSIRCERRVYRHCITLNHLQIVVCLRQELRSRELHNSTTQIQKQGCCNTNTYIGTTNFSSWWLWLNRKLSL